MRCQCGHEQTVELVWGIHITRLPLARRQILDGTFQVFECESCGEATRVTGQTVYTDFDRHHYVAIEPHIGENWVSVRALHDRVFEDSFTNGPGMASEMGVKFKKRMVFGFPALREKLMIWDADLDDLVVEALKAELADRAGLDAGEALFRLSGVLPGGHLTFLRFPADDPYDCSEDDTEISRTRVADPVDADTVLAAEYRRRLERRADIANEFWWLGDDWLVDFHDGYVTFPPLAAALGVQAPSA
jgi:hypothetical protein